VANPLIVLAFFLLLSFCEKISIWLNNKIKDFFTNLTKDLFENETEVDRQEKTNTIKEDVQRMQDIMKKIL
jgi:hypothetical protein